MRYKKINRILLAALAFIMFIQVNSGFTTPGAAMFSLIPETTAVRTGDRYTVKLHVANADNIYGFEAVISYDCEMTEFVREKTKAPFDEGFAFYKEPEGMAGTLVVVYTRTGKTAQSINGDTDLFNIGFKGIKVGTAELVLESVKVLDKDGKIQTNTIGTTISIVYGEAGPTVTPTPTPGYEPQDADTTPAQTPIVTVSPEPVPLDALAGIVRFELGEQAYDIFSKEGITTIEMQPVSGAVAYALVIPPDSLSDDLGEGLLNFSTEFGSITIPGNMLEGIPEAEGKEVEITIGNGDKSLLSDELKESIGDRPLIKLTMMLDQSPFRWDNPGAPVTVSIPYEPAEEELADPEHIVVWYIDGDGNVIPVPNGRYDSETGLVTFTVTHFSFYAVAYVHKTFGDLNSVEWARKPIEVMASKGIIKGTGGNAFSPSLYITRADYLLLLVRILELRGEADDNFDDVKPDAYYYEAVGIAKKLGITNGVGNNRFNPAEHISRQDMMVLTARALMKLKGFEAKGGSAVLDKFTDRTDIADYAKESIAALVSEELILGSADRLNPRGWTTRAEAAVFLYRIYNRFSR